MLAAAVAARAHSDPNVADLGEYCGTTDPWGSPYQLATKSGATTTELEISSWGQDGLSDTEDDLAVTLVVITDAETGRTIEIYRSEADISSEDTDPGRSVDAGR